jgi:hypothetical protein
MSAPPTLDFDSRSTALELMDEPGLDPAELAETLGELAFVNKFLGGHASTLDGMARLIPPDRREFDVLDVGSGGGDTARRIVAFVRSCRRGTPGRAEKNRRVSAARLCFSRHHARKTRKSSRI